MIKFFLTAVLLIASEISFGHGDHIPPVASCPAKECSKEQIEAGVPNAIQLLTKSGKIDSNWLTSKIEKIEQKQFAKGPEWVATLFDANQKDKSKQKLFIFITNKGYISGVNYTGE
jgi:hypothetical protein